MNKTQYFLFLSVSAIIFSGSFTGLPMAHAVGNQISLRDLGVLQLAAHDLFNVDRGDRINANTATDFENGKLDLSTLFIDMTTGESFDLSEIELGGEPRNRENIILFSVATSIGQKYVQDYNNFGEQTARQNALGEYHSLFHTAYFNAFGESVPQSKYGCVTMTENLAFRTVHDFLPDMIEKDGNPPVPIFSLLPPFAIADALTEDELDQFSSELDGVFDFAFTQPLFIEIQPGVFIDIPSLLSADTDFAFQFNTLFPFTGPTGFLTELESGSYASTNALDQIRNLIAKGYGHGCYVGGESIPIDSASLILAGAQTFSWMIPVLLSGIGIGLLVASRKN
jgi:hypothetical protein